MAGNVMQSVQGFTGTGGAPVGVQQGAYAPTAPMTRPSTGQANLGPAVPGTQPMMR